jgi:hypothetical protein
MKNEINENKALSQTSVMCCDSFKKNIHNFGWFKLDHLGEEQYLMPHILGTNYRINFCPSCGKEVRDVVLSYDFYHNT